MRIAVIDIGTNSIHMLIADVLSNSTFEIIGKEKEMVRLGDGTLSSGRLSQKVMARGLETLMKFARLARSKGVQKIWAVATSAVRESRNGGDFIETVLNQTGIDVKVITGEEEGRLINLAVRHTKEWKREKYLLIDIGGGSVEIVLSDLSEIYVIKSLKLGAARVRDLFLKKGTSAQFKATERFLEKTFKELSPLIQKIGFQKVIGTSGTIQNLATMAGSLYRGANPRSKALTLSFKELKWLYTLLKKSTSDQRVRMKGLDPLRNDSIQAGAAVAYVFMKTFKIQEMDYCDRALREGMIYDFMERYQKRLKSELEIPNVRLRNVLKIATRCDYDRKHAEQAKRLAIQIFDQLQPFHHLTAIDRELLGYAALLHDIGYHISYDRHHHHGYYLIKNMSMDGFQEEEINLLAHTVRYHRRSLPKNSHSEFICLEQSVRHRICWLASILRVADALDRTRFSVVKSIRISKRSEKLLFQLKTGNDSEYEVWEAIRKSDLLTKMTGLEVVFRQMNNPRES